MKTIFEWLSFPPFRRRPGMYIGCDSIRSLMQWMGGYKDACLDAGHEECLTTSNGLPFFLLRDYIAFREKDRSVGGIDFILLESVGGEEKKAWEKFFSYVDEYRELTICDSQTYRFTGHLTLYYNVVHAKFEWKKNDSGHADIARLTVNRLSNGMCWVEEHRSSISSSDASEDCFSCLTPSDKDFVFSDEEMKKTLNQFVGEYEVVSGDSNTAATEESVRAFLNELVGRKVDYCCCEADILDIGFSGEIVLHGMGLSRVSLNNDILLTTIDYQSWDKKIDTNNDEWYNVERFRNKIVGGTVLSVSYNRIHDLRIVLDNNIVIECFIANGYPHYSDETEQWVLFERGPSGKYLSVSGKSLDWRA